MPVTTLLRRVHPAKGFVYERARMEALIVMWTYKQPKRAERFLDHWIRSTMCSRLEPMKHAAKSLRSHRELILNRFRAKGEISAAITEGKSNRLKVCCKMAYGHHGLTVMQVLLYHKLDELPEPLRLTIFS